MFISMATFLTYGEGSLYNLEVYSALLQIYPIA